MTHCASFCYLKMFFVDQEQPHLLDPHLEELVGILVSLVKEVGETSFINPNDEFYRGTKAPKLMIAQQAFKYIYLLIKVRGYKIIVNKLPHEVSMQLHKSWS